MTKTCPHKNISRCPLYVESHNVRGLGCVDNIGNDCKVERGKSYNILVEKLVEVDALLVFQCQSAEIADIRREQRERNLRLNGIRQ